MKRLRNIVLSVATDGKIPLASDLMREWLDRQRRERHRRAIIEGCR